MTTPAVSVPRLGLRRAGGPPSVAAAAQVGLVAMAAVWGSTFVMVQDAVVVLPVFAFLAYRFLAAAVLVGIAFRRDLRAIGRDGWRMGAAMGVVLTAGYVLQTESLLHTTAANSGFITGLFVVVTPLLGALVLRRPAGRPAWLGAAACAIGLALLAGVGSNLQPLGDGLALGAAVAFAAHILLTDAAVGRHAVGALLAIQLAVCGVVCLAAALALGDLRAPAGASVWGALVVCSLVATALGFWIQSVAQRHAPPARIALILASEPAFAGLFGVLVAGDRLTAAGWAGAALIVGAIVAVETVPRLRAAPV